MSDNLVGKLVKELQKLGLQQPSASLPEKLTRSADFGRWEARMKYYLRGVDTSSQSGTILGLLDDEVYYLAQSSGISTSIPASDILDRLRAILGASVHPWIMQSEFRDRFQQPGGGVLDYQQALRLLGRRAFPTMDAAALTQRVLEQFVAGVRDPEVWKALMREQPATLDKALDLARQEEALQANQWRRPSPRRPNGPQNRRSVQSIDVGPQDSSGRSKQSQRDLPTAANALKCSLCINNPVDELCTQRNFPTFEQWITYADKCKPPCPFNRRWRLPQTILFVFGKDKIQHRWSVLRFNPHLGKEERIADMEEHIWASYSLVGESIFAVGGDTAQGRFSTSVEEFLVGERRWCKRASLGVGRNGYAAAVVTKAGGEALIGVFGGYNGGCLSSCEVYEVSRDRWFKLPDLREKRNDTAAACLPARRQ
nr:unnamed protein product [Spirometra erinaceieuropaei]